MQFCPNKSAAGVICNRTSGSRNSITATAVATVEVLVAGMQLLARCLADVIQSHSGAKVFIEEEVPALTRVVNGHRLNTLGWILSFNLNGSVTYLDVSTVAPFSCNPSLVSAASTKPGFMAEESGKEQI